MGEPVRWAGCPWRVIRGRGGCAAVDGNAGRLTGCQLLATYPRPLADTAALYAGGCRSPFGAHRLGVLGGILRAVIFHRDASRGPTRPTQCASEMQGVEDLGGVLVAVGVVVGSYDACDPSGMRAATSDVPPDQSPRTSGRSWRSASRTAQVRKSGSPSTITIRVRSHSSRPASSPRRIEAPIWQASVADPTE
jgi:hypothetical protein